MKKLILFIFLIPCIKSYSQKIKPGEAVIKAMYNMYNDKWFKHFTFTQDAIFYKDGKEDKKEVWHEAVTFPGNLVIKYDSMGSKNGVIFTNNTVCSIKDGIAKTPRPFIHDLLLVGFDVYFLQPERSIRLLDSLGYNLKLVHEDVFEGRKVIVVGAEKGDEKSNQFWIDAEHLYMHRVVYNKVTVLMDVVFANYDIIEKNRVAKKVIFKQNGQLILIEQYYNIKFPQKLNMDIYIPEKFSETKW